MPVTVVRFNLVAPGASPAELGARCRAALEMAAYADDRGITTVQTEEHHGAVDNWLPSPFVFAGAALGATRRIAVTVSAMIGPLHDPLRLAEEIAVLEARPGVRRAGRESTTNSSYSSGRYPIPATVTSRPPPIRCGRPGPVLGAVRGPFPARRLRGPRA
ncbi:LLM class flavin-dependent oxidoreductase [Streptomyces sp. H28]|uniref:LLM class flavin-dependent oxidoreductase n=1 Tax=Streptomyces sp. H28 TaxID=2775865 RepID=UPI003F57C362